MDQPAWLPPGSGPLRDAFPAVRADHALSP